MFFFAKHTLLAACVLAAATMIPAEAALIYATGRNLSNSDYATGPYYYQIDTATGAATPISPLLTSNGPNGLGAVGAQLVGFSDGTPGTIDPVAGVFTPVGSSTGFVLPGYEVLDGAGYGVPSSGADRRLQRIDLTTGAATALGEENPIGAAMDAFYGDASGVNNPSILSLGSVEGTLYGVNSAAGKYNLVSLDPLTGNATILGTANAVATSGMPGARYDGFSALTGVDENGDGVYDTLYGNINFYDPDGLTGPAAQQNFGGVVRYDLNDGTWSLVGSNPGIIFFGFGSPVPEPGAPVLAMLGLVAAWRRRRR